MTQTDDALLPCHSCGSRLGPFLSAPDGNQQVICSTCGMRGPYENLVETAAEKWNALAPATDAQATARAISGGEILSTVVATKEMAATLRDAADRIEQVISSTKDMEQEDQPHD
jgi:hypothetical protein